MATPEYTDLKSNSTTVCTKGDITLVYPSGGLETTNGCSCSKISTGIPNLEDLTMFVSLTAIRRGKSLIRDDMKSQEILIANITEDSDNNLNIRNLTTNWTDNLTDGNYDVNDYETLGIKDIQVTIGENYIPKVNLTLVDIRGEAIFHKNSKFKVFFEIPYPVFRLTLKGYYGRALTYDLHLFSWTSNFESNTGDFNIRCEFIGFSYAFLTDIIMSYVLAVPNINTSGIGISESDEEKLTLGIGSDTVPTLKEFISIVSSLEETKDFAINTSDYKDLEKTKEKIESIKNVLRKYFISVDETSNVVNGIYYQSIDKKDFIIIKYDNLDEAEIKSLANSYEILYDEINEVVTQIKNDGKTIKLTLSKTDQDINWPVEDLKYATSNSDFTSIYKNELDDANKCNVGDDGCKIYSFIATEKLKKQLQDILNEYTSSYQENKNKVNNNLQTKIKNILNKDNVDLTAKSIFDVLIKNIQYFLNTMRVINKLALNYHEKNNSDYGDEVHKISLDGETPDTVIVYPWPEYRIKDKTVERDCKEVDTSVLAYPGENPKFRDWPEVKFVEALVESLLNLESDLSLINAVSSNSSYQPVTFFDSAIPIEFGKIEDFDAFDFDFKPPQTLLNKYDNITDEDVPYAKITDSNQLYKIMSQRFFTFVDSNNLIFDENIDNNYFKLENFDFNSDNSDSIYANFINTEFRYIKSIIGKDTLNQMFIQNDTSDFELDKFKENVSEDSGIDIYGGIKLYSDSEEYTTTVPTDNIKAPKIALTISQSAFLSDIELTSTLDFNVDVYENLYDDDALLKELNRENIETGDVCSELDECSSQEEIDSANDLDNKRNEYINIKTIIDNNINIDNIFGVTYFSDKKNYLELIDEKDNFKDSLNDPNVTISPLNINSDLWYVTTNKTVGYEAIQESDNKYFLLIDDKNELEKSPTDSTINISKFNLTKMLNNLTIFSKLYHNYDVFSELWSKTSTVTDINMMWLLKFYHLDYENWLNNSKIDDLETNRNFLPRLIHFNQHLYSQIDDFRKSILEELTSLPQIETTEENNIHYMVIDKNNNPNLFKLIDDVLKQDKKIKLYITSAIMVGSKNSLYNSNDSGKTYLIKAKDKVNKFSENLINKFNLFLTDYFTHQNEVLTRKKIVTSKTEGVFTDHKLKIYTLLKNFNDKWISEANFEGDVGIFKNLRNSFVFTDRAMRDISTRVVLNPVQFLSLKNSSNTSAFAFINLLLSKNNFSFYPLSNLIGTVDENGVYTYDVIEELFDIHPYGYNNLLGSTPMFLSVYYGGESQHLDLNPGVAGDLYDKENWHYRNDGFDLCCDCSGNKIPKDLKKCQSPTTTKDDVITPNNEGVKAFVIDYGNEKQSIFKDIQLDQSNFTETAETLEVLDDIISFNGEIRNTFKGQSLYTIHEKRSYTARVTCLGNMHIQPMMIFQLNNIPLFHGSFLILSVSHNISMGEFTTTFEGVRMPINVKPINTKYLDVVGITLPQISDDISEKFRKSTKNKKRTAIEALNRKRTSDIGEFPDYVKAAANNFDPPNKPTDVLPRNYNQSYFKFHLSEGQFFDLSPSQLPRRKILILHHTASCQNPFSVIAQWDRSWERVGTEWVIGGNAVVAGNPCETNNIGNGTTNYDGAIVQAHPFGAANGHIGVSLPYNLSLQTIGVELTNPGWLIKDKNTDKYYRNEKDDNGQPYIAWEVEKENVIDLYEYYIAPNEKYKFNGHRYFPKYSTAQINSLKELLIHIFRENPDIKWRDYGLIADISKLYQVSPVTKQSWDIVELFAFDGFSHVHGPLKINESLEISRENAKKLEQSSGVYTHANFRKGKTDVFPDPSLVKMLYDFYHDYDYDTIFNDDPLNGNKNIWPPAGSAPPATAVATLSREYTTT